MSAPMIAAQAARTNGEPLSPVEFVRALSPDDKEEVLAVLLEELIDLHDNQGAIIFNRPGHKSLGYLVTPGLSKIRFEKMLEQLPPEIRQEIANPTPSGVDFEDCLTPEAAWAMVKAQEQVVR